MTGRRASDWLRSPASQGGDDERSGGDRRGADRRAPRRRIDPLFAASLINQIRPGAENAANYAPTPSPVRTGRLVNRWA